MLDLYQESPRHTQVKATCGNQILGFILHNNLKHESLDPFYGILSKLYFLHGILLIGK
jgi:hypothetical protein